MEKRKNNDYEILTSDGWSDFSGIGKTVQDSYKITFEDNSFIICTLNHKFFENEKYIKYSDLKIGDSLSGKKIKNLEKTNKKEDMYDILGVEKNHHFTLSETGIESSNCAFVPKNMWNEFWTSTYPTISSGKESKLIMVSCVTKDTLVITDKGISYVNDFIDNSKEGAYYTNEYKILGKNKLRSGRIMFNSGFAPTRRIYTSHTELECSLEHKLWGCVKNKETGEYEHRWVKSEELSIGDYVAVQYGYNIWGNDDTLDIDIISYEIDSDLAYFFGIFLMVGFYNNSTIYLKTKLDISETLYNISINDFKYENNIYTFSSERICNILKYVGLSKNSKIIPKKLLSMSRKNIVSLLQGIFDIGGTTKDNFRIEFCSKNKKLCLQIQFILLNFGIRCELRTTTRTANKKKILEQEKLIKLVAKNFDSKATQYYIDIRTFNSFVFYKLIGYKNNKNQNHLYDIEKIIKKYIDYDKVPHVKELLKKCGVPKHKVINGIDTNLFFYKTHNMSNVRMIKNYDLFLKYAKRNKEEIIKFYKENVDKNIFWSRIRKIEESENYVYDFSLDNTDEIDTFSHSVIYNGIIGHQTPNGHNHFYDFWENAIRGRSDMVPVEVNWWDVPGRDEEWHKKILKNMSDEQFEVEYGNSFSSSSNTLIPSYVFKRLQDKIKSPIECSNHLSIYKKPEKNHNYILSCDPSSVGKDFSAFHVIDITQFPYEQVCVFYQNDISHLSLPQIIYQIATRYNNADVLVESNEIGSTILHILNYEIEYENVIKTFSSGKNEPILGQRTTAKSKALGCQELKTLIVDEGLLIYNEDTLNELRNFVLHNTSYAAVSGEHDDLCMALVIFAYYVSSPRFKMVNEKNYVDEYRERMDKEIIEQLQPLPFTSNNIDED